MGKQALAQGEQIEAFTPKGCIVVPGIIENANNFGGGEIDHPHKLGNIFLNSILGLLDSIRLNLLLCIIIFAITFISHSLETNLSYWIPNEISILSSALLK